MARARAERFELERGRVGERPGGRERSGLERERASDAGRPTDAGLAPGSEDEGRGLHQQGSSGSVDPRGTVIDGSGRAGRRADVVVKGGTVAHVGQVAPDLEARQQLDAARLVVAPGS